MRRTKSGIKGLKVHRVWSEDPLVLMEEVKGFFENLFQKKDFTRVKLDGVHF